MSFLKLESAGYPSIIGADAVGYDKLAPREKSAPDTSVVSLPEQQQEESAA